MSVPKNILIVEDDAPIRQLIRKTLQQEGWQVHEAQTVERALIDGKARQPECIILDLGLAGTDGMQFIKEWRKWSDTPIIVLTARQQENSKVMALDLGANDYMTKPFGIAELLARVRVQVRQRQPQSNQEQYVFGPNVVDFNQRCITRNNQVVHLTPTEYLLLLELIRNEGKVCTQRHLLLAIWGPDYVEDAQYLRIYMGKLRQKLEDDAANPKYFMTEVSIGYRFLGALAT